MRFVTATAQASLTGGQFVQPAANFREMSQSFPPTPAFAGLFRRDLRQFEVQGRAPDALLFSCPSSDLRDPGQGHSSIEQNREKRR
jgi:hypothetical protein